MNTEHRPWAGSASRYGSIGEHGNWKLALDEYYWDRLESAYATARDLGTGQAGYGLAIYRMIEAEYLTRQHSETRPLREWLQFETIRQEVDDAQEVGQRVLEACEVVGKKLSWSHEAPTLVSVLSEESDAPWTLGRYGYMVDKYPLDKICIPLASLSSDEGLSNVIRHEYAHVVNLNMTQGRIPRWLDEAIAMGVEEPTGDPSAPFRQGAPWLSSEELESAFGLVQNDPRHQPGLHLAYMQSAVIGRYLLGEFGSGAFAMLLEAFADNTSWTEIKMAVTGQAAVDEATQEAFKTSVEDLFERARP